MRRTHEENPRGELTRTLHRFVSGRLTMALWYKLLLLKVTLNLERAPA